MSPRRVVSLLAVLAAAALIGCGAAEPQARAPAGYAVHDGKRASFAYPDGWKVTEQPPSGERSEWVTALPPGTQAGDVSAQVELRVTELGEDSFEEMLADSAEARDAILSGRGAKTTDVEADVAGAEESRAFDVTYRSNEGRPYRARSVVALLDDDTVVMLTAGASDGDELDIDGAVSSLQLK